MFDDLTFQRSKPSTRLLHPQHLARKQNIDALLLQTILLKHVVIGYIGNSGIQLNVVLFRNVLLGKPSTYEKLVRENNLFSLNFLNIHG